MLNKTFQELRIQRVALEGMILKPNMAISGKSAKQAGVDEGGNHPSLKSCVPAAYLASPLSGDSPTRTPPRTSCHE